ncbi:HNH endonuclease signature motif containing protein [Cellulomonas hominis]|uniref:HNH endonuclease signature motif containing protein n=1 Tax=Cellulomonas hominis TaxID=156981 RepID=UPI001B9FD2B9|nr:HNH endonuclease signature motif containing protein [Cellulomonas hominis]VTR76260.1 hypothetical protein CHMI_01016 [Cellulomonas hominis]
MPADLDEHPASPPTHLTAPWAEVGRRERAADFRDRLEATPTGSPLVGALESLERDGFDALGDHERLEVVAAAARLEAWAHAVKARAAAALDRHASMRPPRERPRPGTALVSRNITAASIAMRLRCSPREADTLVREGVSYGGALADTGAALASGTIDVPRARAVVDRLWGQMPQIAAHVQAEVLPRAGGRTAHQVRRDVERALVEVAPDEATDRHRAARDGRYVSRPLARPDGMAGLWVLLPAVQAVQIDCVLEAAARTARAAGDTRTLAQLRADGMCDLVLGAAPGGRPATPATAEGPGRGRALGGDDDAVGAADDALPDTPTAPQRPRTQVLVTVPLSTLMGLDDDPAELAGYGPLDAVQARALAWEGTWRRLVTDDLSGTVLDVGRTRYRPPAALDEHVRIRDRTCSAPGCHVPADRADLDHTREFHRLPGDDTGTPPGGTSHDNLGPVCRYHHRLKSETGFTLHQTSPGTFAWTDPTGHQYLVVPGLDGAVRELTVPPHQDDGPPF